MEKFLYEIKKVAAKFLDPFIVLGILMVFAIPTIAILNLTPDWHHTTQGPDSVLGTSDQTNLLLIPYQIPAEGINLTQVYQSTENSFSLTIEHVAHLKGKYTNTLFEIYNPTEFQKQLGIMPSFIDIPEGTTVSLKIDDVYYVILENGVTYPAGIYIQGGEKLTVYVAIESQNDVNFDSNFLMDVNWE